MAEKTEVVCKGNYLKFHPNYNKPLFMFFTIDIKLHLHTKHAELLVALFSCFTFIIITRSLKVNVK